MTSETMALLVTPCRQTTRTLIALAAFCCLATPSQAGDPPTRAASGASQKKKILVELYTSQGCNSCPAAEKVFGDMKQLGVDPSRLVPIAFHVDYFNKPWSDPYSDPLYSRREYQYSLVYQKAMKIEDPNYLYFTPMMMIDGRHPMLGSNVAEAKKAFGKVLDARPGATISAVLSGVPSDAQRTVEIRVRPLAAEMPGKTVLVAVALTENPVVTKVASGENGGKTLTEHFAVRQFQGKETSFGKNESKTFTFSIKAPAASKPESLSLAIFVQDLTDGKIYQAESVPFVTATKP